MTPMISAADADDQRALTDSHGDASVRSNAITLLVTFLGLATTAGLMLFLTRDLPLMGDEHAHLSQINGLENWIRTGAPFTPSHPAFPGYHFMIAVIASIAEGAGVAAYRAITLGLNLLVPLSAFAVALTLSNDSQLSALRMGQVFFLGIAFPFLALLYTDLFSAGTVLVSFAMLFRKRYTLAGMVGTLAVAVRQNNVLWLGLMFLFAAVHLRNAYPFTRPQKLRWNMRLAALCARLSTFLAGFVAVAIFVAWNGGQLALADRNAHPPFTFHLGNVWSIIIAAFFLFLPHGLSQAKSVVQLVREHPDVAAVGALTISFVYLITFTNTHPYNFLPWWLHNKFVLLATSSMIWKLAFLVPVLYQTMVFAITPLWREELLLFYPTTIVYLAASWLIEPRYFLIPLFLFVLFRRPQERWLEATLLVWNVLLSVLVFWGVWRGIWLP